MGLQDYIDTFADRSSNAFVFAGRQPGTWLSKTAGWRAIKRAFRSEGIVGAPTEIGTHTLRKTLARLIYGALGHVLVRTSHAIWHASVATTIKYLSFREEDVAAAILRSNRPVGE